MKESSYMKKLKQAIAHDEEISIDSITDEYVLQRKQRMGAEFHPINFHPMKSNILDYVGRDDLFTRDERQVTISQNMALEFIVKIDDYEVFRSVYNLAVATYLNRLEVGLFG
jgi:hypothetical protein